MTNHVPTLATCQKLKAAGFPQDVYFYFYRRASWPIDNPFEFGHEPDPAAEDCYAAPLLTEILEQLTETDKYNIPLGMYWGSVFERGWVASYDDYPKVFHPNPAEAAALLWLELKENS